MSTENITYVGGIKHIETIQEEFEKSTLDLIATRYIICNPCENKIGDSCSKCSCLLSVRTSYVESFCPIGEW